MYVTSVRIDFISGFLLKVIVKKGARGGGGWNFRDILLHKRTPRKAVFLYLCCVQQNIHGIDMHKK
jgi:hypothetical protein